MRAKFATTHWSVVLASARKDTPTGQKALATLCEQYWYPVYAYLRRQGLTADEAQDLTQAFFARLLEKGYFQQAQPARGRFRSFLLAAVKHFLANERDRARAKKRGGGTPPVSLNFASAEREYQRDPPDAWTPERIYDRRWALTLLETVLARLRDEFMRSGKEEIFNALKIHLTYPQSDEPYAVVAARLGMSEGAVKVAVHRLRRRFRELLRDEIGHTVATPEEVDGEIRYLFAALSFSR